MAGRREPYADRAEAGRELAAALAAYAGRPALLVLGLVRGGVPVAAQVATALGAPLQPMIVRKVGAPGRPELAMGAIADVGGHLVVVRNPRVIDRFAGSEDDFAAGCAREQARLHEAVNRYRGSAAAARITGSTVILVDDGLATGASMRAAVAAVRELEPARTVVAIPIAAPRSCQELAGEVDEVVCPWQPEHFGSVGAGYRNFDQVDDGEVLALLSR